MSRETIKELHDVKCPYCDKEFVLSTCTYPTLIDWTMRREQIEEVRTATIEEISKLDLPDQTKETYIDYVSNLPINYKESQEIIDGLKNKIKEKNDSIKKPKTT